MELSEIQGDEKKNSTFVAFLPDMMVQTASFRQG